MQSSSLRVVVATVPDAVFLRRVIARAFSFAPTVYLDEGTVALVSTPQGVLMYQGGPLLLVINSETLNQPMTDQAIGETHYLLQLVAPESEFEVFAYVPQLEVAFFEAPEVLRRYLGAEFTEHHRELGLVDSARTLRRVLEPAGHTPESFCRLLDDADLDALLKGPQTAALIAAVEGLLARSRAWQAAHS